jgi:hypothetical protein
MYLKGKDGEPSFDDTFSREVMIPTLEAFHMYNRERTPKAGHLLLDNIGRAEKALSRQRKKKFLVF